MAQKRKIFYTFGKRRRKVVYAIYRQIERWKFNLEKG